MSEQTAETPITTGGVRSVQAPDGTSFDIMAWAPGRAAQARGEALVKMREIVQAREPEILPNLQTREGISAEYAMSAGVNHSKDPDVKADLTRVYVGWHLAEGDRAGAVRALSYARVAELPLPEFGNEFATDQYSASLTENNPSDAWSIAYTMINERDAILKPEPQTTEQPSSEWIAREKEAFKLWAEDTVAKTATSEDIADELDLMHIYDFMRYREDGFNTDTPSELARKVGERMVEKDIARGRQVFALQHAVEAKMPDDYIAQLRRKVSPTAIEQFTDWLNGLRAKAAQIITRK